jgi:hypothetical protein
LHQLDLLNQISGALLRHHRIITFEGGTRRKLLDNVWDPTPSTVSSSTDALPDRVETVLCIVSVDRFTTRSVMMHHIKVFKLVNLNIDQQLVVLLFQHGMETAHGKS